jgi:hypothetical protein
MLYLDIFFDGHHSAVGRRENQPVIPWTMPFRITKKERDKQGEQEKEQAERLQADETTHQRRNAESKNIGITFAGKVHYV